METANHPDEFDAPKGHAHFLGSQQYQHFDDSRRDQSRCHILIHQENSPQARPTHAPLLDNASYGSQNEELFTKITAM